MKSLGVSRWEAAVLVPWTAAVIVVAVLTWHLPDITWTWGILFATVIGLEVFFQLLCVAAGRLVVTGSYVPLSLLMVLAGPTTMVPIACFELVADRIRFDHRWWNALTVLSYSLVGIWAYHHVALSVPGGTHACVRSVGSGCIEYLSWLFAIYMSISVLNFAFIWAGGFVLGLASASGRFRWSSFFGLVPAQALAGVVFVTILAAWSHFGVFAIVALGIIIVSFLTLAQRMLVAEQRAHDLVKLTAALKEHQEGALAALLAGMSARDAMEAHHAQRVCELSVMCADELGLDDTEREQVRIAALLHDIGKFAFPDALLLSGDGAFSSAEDRMMMRTHPAEGAAQLEQIPALAGVARLVANHHEHVDGTGYPAGLSADEIPLGARIIGVCEAYAAMTSTASYKAPVGDSEARERLRGAASTQFDRQVVDALLVALARLEPLERDLMQLDAPSEAARVPSAPPVEFPVEPAPVGRAAFVEP